MSDYLAEWQQRHRDAGHDPYTYILNGQTWAACRTCYAGTTTVSYPFWRSRSGSNYPSYQPRQQADSTSPRDRIAPQGGMSADQPEGGPSMESRQQADSPTKPIDWQRLVIADPAGDGWVTLGAYVADLVAEVRRLRGLIQSAEWLGLVLDDQRASCPWCLMRQPRGHADNCPAFRPEASA